MVRLAPELKRLDVRLVEQPLKAGEDQALQAYASPVLLCADESLHSRAELAACVGRYGCVNIKLDKAGGLTEAMALAEAATRALGLKIMIGCMVSTSLAMAPRRDPGSQGADFLWTSTAPCSWPGTASRA